MAIDFCLFEGRGEMKEKMIRDAEMLIRNAEILRWNNDILVQRCGTSSYTSSLGKSIVLEVRCSGERV